MQYVITTDGTVRSYKTQTVAAQMAAQVSGVIATDDNLSAVPTSLLVTLYNIIRPEKPIQKFADRATAEKRMKGVLEVLAKPGEAPAASTDEAVTIPEEGADVATKTAGRKRAAKKTTSTKTATDGEGRGRPSKYAGMKVVKIEKANPRREGTSGWRSWEALRSGMTYEAYIAAGGVRRDLEWDIAQGWAKVEKA